MCSGLTAVGTVELAGGQTWRRWSVRALSGAPRLVRVAPASGDLLADSPAQDLRA